MTNQKERKPPQPQVKVPSNLRESRQLKEGHVEDNNEDIAYFNIKVIYPALFFTILSLTAFTIAVCGSLYTDYKPPRWLLKRGFGVKYGSSIFHCNSTVKIRWNDMPSVLNMFEVNVVGNVLFRIAVCLPMVVRIFLVSVWRKVLYMEYEDGLNFLYKACNDLIPILTAVEVFALALFSIITLHMDFPHVNRFCKVVFVITAVTNVFMISIVSFAHGRTATKKIETFAIAVKLVCCVSFCYTAPQFFQQHVGTLIYPLCHSYVPRAQALTEYVMIASYGLFHLTTLIDIRDVSFMCYPRTCSGECEPLHPDNFQKGGKFEHCRAYEYNQRRILNM
ncbi:unnamed protein product [Auanema sp. JU1783]|nr:unnamed protein product [Auanema sp. JU1783]